MKTGRQIRNATVRPWRSAVGRMMMAACVLGMASCGVLKPGTPGHEPPSAGNYNPVANEVNHGGTR